MPSETKAIKFLPAALRAKFSSDKNVFTKAEWIFVALVALYVGLSWFTAVIYGLSDDFYPVMYLSTAAQFAAVFFFFYFLWRCSRAFYIMVRIRPDKLGLYLWHDLRDGPLQKERFIRALPPFIALIFFFSTFTSMKMLIPYIQPFSWDVVFADLDKFIHFNNDPWLVLQPIIGIPFSSFVISMVYILWLGALFLVIYWQIFSLKQPLLRMRFFYSFVLTWAIQGTILAIVFSSAGPCFYEYLTGSERFVPLLDYLKNVNEHFPIWALDTQNMLWETYQSGEKAIGTGISAMPSIHVATAYLFMLLGWRTGSRFIAIGFTLFFAFIMVGSVHLGWHYAIDGYVAIILTHIIWRISGLMTGKLCCKSA